MTKEGANDTLVTLVVTMDITVKTDDLVTIAQAAKKLGVSRQTVYRWKDAGKIVSVEVAGSPYILKTEVERLQKERAAVAVAAALSGSRKPQEEVKT